MRYFLALLLSALLSAQLHAEPPAQELELARQLIQAGAQQLALKHIESVQPANANDPSWREWERLRLMVLSRLNQSEELLLRVSKLPQGLPPDFERQAFELAARAAIQSGQGEIARDYLARLLWGFELAQRDQAELRQLVVESYLAQGKAANAYPVMLRYQQDFPQIEKQFLIRFIESLIAAGMDQEAATWLGRLDESSPVRLLLQMRAGLVTPEAAVLQARAALSKKGDSENWGTMLHAASLLKDGRLGIEASEHLLNLPKSPLNARYGISAESLWQRYLSRAEELGNQAHLLVGDDSAWVESAAQLSEKMPADASAMWAYLALRAANPDYRTDALLRLVSGLSRQKLGLTAVRLFQDSARVGELSALPTEVRYSIGQEAFNGREFKVAAQAWKNLDDPLPPLSSQQWQLKRAEVFVRGELYAEAADTLRGVLVSREALSHSFASQVQKLALELNEVGQDQVAVQVLQGLLPMAPSSQQRDILFSLGKIFEARHEYRIAGEYYLRSALAGSGTSPDPLSLMARLNAASNLALAGLKQDAKLQYQIVLRATKDAGQQEVIQRALSKL